MTKERVKQLIINKHTGNGMGVFLAFLFLGLFLFWITGVPYALALVIVGIFYGIKTHILHSRYKKNPESDPIFYVYDSEETLLAVMDEIINHYIYNYSEVRLSDHFILYGDKYENIIRYYDVVGILKMNVDKNKSIIRIYDKYGQLGEMKVDHAKADEIYNFLETKCKNLDNNCWKTMNEKDCYNAKESIIFSISYDHKLTMKEVFGEDYKLEAKKDIKKSDENDVPRKESKELNENDNSKKETKTSMNQKYDDLKKLKELLDNDILTKEEYDREKNKILEG